MTKGRTEQRFENLEKAVNQLSKFYKKPELNELEEQGFIKSFEYCFELSWKVMKDFLESEGFIIKSPRDSIKEAFSFGLIENGTLWLEALKNRNLLVHTYDETLAKEVVEDIIKKYYKMILDFTKEMRNRI